VTKTNISAFTWDQNQVVLTQPNQHTGRAQPPHADLRNMQVCEVLAQVGIECTCGQQCVSKKGGPIEIQNPTHRDLISGNVIAPPPVLLPSSVLLPPFCIVILFHKKQHFTLKFHKLEIAHVQIV
jgi:hypothetical protein